MKIYTNDFKCEKYDNLYFEYEGNDSFLYVSDKIYKLDGENYYEIDFMINTKNEAYEYKVNNTTYLVDPENVVFKKLDVPLMYIDKQHYVINEKHFVYRVDENIALIKNITSTTNEYYYEINNPDIMSVENIIKQIKIFYNNLK